MLTRPREMEDVDDWGIPPPVDPNECSDQLRDKVDNFLRLKYERGQHVNSTLLGSSSFSNPHIYAKLVEYVDITERASAFPSGGWLTRQDLEDQIPKYGPTALNAVQKAKQDEVRRNQETGKRSNINFQSAKHDDSRPREREWRRGDEKKVKGDRARDREREKDRDRERYKRDDRNGGRHKH
ncbi:hypothetical protein TREMEDRAFT_34326 [Tremella mesenterica DSM 1558]|nr:uncharacterized protein TREMEDRAFT_34326 [Tremella mesenterica DSM 1558]EIW67000.1 hypothetical protein TREMEDRAFT_34326 [Tremella mesenterica DSM 1558]